MMAGMAGPLLAVALFFNYLFSTLWLVSSFWLLRSFNSILRRARSLFFALALFGMLSSV
jgi:hypothetical protein